MEQEHIFLVTVHEVGAVFGVLVVVKMLVPWNIHNLHLGTHEMIPVVVRRQTHEAVEHFMLSSVF